MNNISFAGKFMIDSKELSKLSLLQKAELLKQKDALVDEFCKRGTAFQKINNGFVVNIKDEKENVFLEITKKLGLALRKIVE